ncbi:MAG TPA: type II toxin-antitoxin system HipA family toxin [Solirubrobacterales bacterium]|nr:type II toxin-antitoxin system HipA family toxin [Solirubrobacterales bacterium]
MAERTLNVFLHNELAGVLRRKDNGNLQFRYDGAYLDAGGRPLSLNLPLRAEAFPHRESLAFFGNLLPEEGVRAQLALTTGISASNDYKLLERFGGDVAGAITLLPPAEGPADPEPDELELLSPERLDEILVELPQRPLAADEAGEVRLSLAGAQSKLPVVEVENGFALPHGSGRPTTHILKPEPERFPGLVANEFFCMRLAAAAGLEVAEVERAETLSGLPYLIVTRYDRDLTQEPVRRLHQEDLCQALGKLPIEKYQQEGGPGVVEAMALIDAASTAPARDRPQLWLALAFNVLIGNCDAHGKNYSLLYDSRAPSLAPLYDLVSTAAYDVLTSRLAMSIDGAKSLDEVRYAAWRRLAEEIRFAPRFLEQRMEPFVARVLDAVPELAAEPEHSHEIVREIAVGIAERAERLAPPRPLS